jgi:hypothetical protein
MLYGASKEVAEGTKQQNYYWRWLVQALSQTFFWGWPQFVLVLTTIAVLVLNVEYGATSASKFAPQVHALMIVYLWSLIGYLVIQIFRAPLILDRQRAEEIGELRKRLGEAVTVEFEPVTFRQPLPNLRNTSMHINISLRTGDVPATLRDWALRSKSKPNLNPVAVSVVGDWTKQSSHTIRLEAHATGHGFVRFDFMGKAQATEDEIRECDWILVFSDAHREYAEAIPQQMLKKT